ncbi:MAG: ribosomal RNA small subunit methyltransferase A [Lentisphaerae bacterium]|nr:ribosomal RNA small subunit methyltransferase A [Lentisphaerota bacterium]
MRRDRSCAQSQPHRSDLQRQFLCDEIQLSCRRRMLLRRSLCGETLIMNKQQLIETLESLGMRPGRGLGQNFLLDGNLLDWIVRSSHAASGEKILEVGPGFGALTEKLLQTGAELTAIEFDHRIAGFLRKKFADHPRFNLVEADACKVDYDELFPAGVTYRAIANLPYAISSVFIAKMLNCENPPQSMFFMLQKEMGERLAAVPGSKAYGALSVRTQLFYEVAVEKIVPPQVFCPPPEVDSALVSFKLRSEPLCDIDTAVTVSWLVRTLFNQRRKQMGKVLGNMIGKEVAAAAMAEVALPLEVRPDKLPVAKFVELAHAVMPYLDNSQK